MPELPEVETLRRGLEALLAGRTIRGARVLVPKMIKGTVADAEGLAQVLQGTRIETIGRRGKHLIFTLDSGYHLLLHLKMRGQLLVTDRAEPDARYLAVALLLEDGRELRFHDMWTWGEMRLVTAQELSTYPALLGMGQEPLSEAWTPQSFGAALAKKPKTSIKAALLDQTVVAGVGNIYADESLFRAHVLPTRAAGALNAEETVRLHEAIRAVLTEAIGGGGTTSDNYVDAEGAVGRYTPQVYNRAGLPCAQCQTPLSRIKIIGRGTVFCPRCQT